MPASPRLQQIEDLLKTDPDDEFLRYAQAMEYSSLGDDASAVTHLQALIALNPSAPYIPAFLMCGQALLRLDREKDAAEVLRAGIAATTKLGVSNADAMHAKSELQGLLDSIE
jgi:predicted Zn-dependent protease